MAEKSLGKFLVYCVLLLVLFLVMIQVVFAFGGKLIRLELIGLGLLIFLTFVGFLGYKRNWGERVLFFVFLFSLGNLIVIWFYVGELFLLPLFLSLVGFLMGLPRREEEGEEESSLEEEPYSEVLEEKKVKTEYSPGKYVASKRGSVYHEPTCEWAKKIATSSQVWFDDKKGAKSEKYKAHSCVK